MVEALFSKVMMVAMLATRAPTKVTKATARSTAAAIKSTSSAFLPPITWEAAMSAICTATARTAQATTTALTPKLAKYAVLQLTR